MSTVGNSTGITFGGLSSGIDTEGIIAKLAQVEAQPVQRMQTQQAQLQVKKQALTQLSQYLSNFAQAAGALNTPTAFNLVSANSSTPATATLTGSSAATAGVYNLTVSYLAQAQKVSSAPKTDTTSALGLSAGTFVVNGKSVAVTATDSLSSLAQKVNALGAGVTASLIDGGSGSAYLTFAANSTGTANKIQLADLTGTTLSSLGVLTGATSAREAITNGATSFGFSASSTAMGTLFGASGNGPSDIQINGTTVSIDLATDSLQGVADKINAAATGATATVRSVTTNGTTSYKLDISGASTPTFTDGGNVLQSLGILQKATGSELVVAQDAQYTLDGVALKSSTNTVSSAIPGATLTLLTANATTPTTSVLSLSRDTNGIAAKVQSLADSYNGLQGYITSATAFDKSTFNTAALFGDSSTVQVQSTMTNMLFTNVPGLTGNYTNLASIGFSFDTDGKLQVDSTKLNTAINTAPNDVANLFKATGQGSTNDISYVSSTSKTKANGSAYNVNITQLATKASFLAGSVQTAPSTAAETLTFGGSLLANTPYQLTLDVGSTAADAVSKINSDSKLKDLIVASIDGSGALKIDSKRYGTSGGFSIVSNKSTAIDNSGIGVGGVGNTVSGLDVSGTINGEAATGSGQFLTGNVGNALTEGLQIQYAGTTTGAIGNLRYSKGMGAQINDLSGTFTDATSGLLTTSQNALQAQSDSLQANIDNLNIRLTDYQNDLRTKFAAMETAIANAHTQSTQLSRMFG